ncbi:glycosyltransferase family 2 protein [Tahibacter amnicola]|uniref:Glycosyltransferase n=1 Tax=Tahibacter amnicola TaxID=2976241 RepID=A0ABY6BFJ6_9GAMM|nr:glycosyltransferase family 2 protein [Tahibacter amnicola]UXI66642.1 glycosyltransferase [Tahibacter amnicola]
MNATVHAIMMLIFGYYMCLHGIYLLLILIGATQLRRYHLGINYGDFKRIAESQLTMPFSVIVPAYNEEMVIVNTVQGALALRYPQHEVIVVNDGSTDATMDLLIKHFGLRQIHKVGPRPLPTKAVRAVYESYEFPNLVVVDKENGKRADAINAAANLSRYPMLCVIDADCVLETDALVRAVRPFLRNSRVVAAGGIVRPANGLEVEDGHIIRCGLPQSFLSLLQTVEYLRSFQWARLGLARLRSMLCISGAFMVVKRDVFLAMKGCDADSITDDIEFTVRLHEHVYGPDVKTKMEIAYIPDPVCYTEVPESMSVFAAQRNRWQRGTLQALLKNRKMAFNPRYGITGLFGMPFFLLFEAFSGVIEGASYVFMVLALVLGLVGWYEIGLFMVFAVLLGTFLSISAVLLQERTRMRVAGTRELGRLLFACLVENFGYHQYHLFHRIVGTFDYLVRHRTDLGEMKRYGTYQKPVAAEPAKQIG